MRIAPNLHKRTLNSVRINNNADINSSKDDLICIRFMNSIIAVPEYDMEFNPFVYTGA